MPKKKLSHTKVLENADIFWTPKSYAFLACGVIFFEHIKPGDDIVHKPRPYTPHQQGPRGGTMIDVGVIPLYTDKYGLHLSVTETYIVMQVLGGGVCLEQLSSPLQPPKERVIFASDLQSSVYRLRYPEVQPGIESVGESLNSKRT